MSTDAEDHPPRDFDDVMAAYDYLKTLPYVDPDRVGIMGWSHGGSSRRISLWLRSRESGIAGTGNGEPRLRVESLFPVPRSQARAKRATDSLFPIPDSRFPIPDFPIPYVPGLCHMTLEIIHFPSYLPNNR